MRAPPEFSTYFVSPDLRRASVSWIYILQCYFQHWKKEGTYKSCHEKSDGSYIIWIWTYQNGPYTFFTVLFPTLKQRRNLQVTSWEEWRVLHHLNLNLPKWTIRGVDNSVEWYSYMFYKSFQFSLCLGDSHDFWKKCRFSICSDYFGSNARSTDVVVCSPFLMSMERSLQRDEVWVFSLWHLCPSCSVSHQMRLNLRGGACSSTTCSPSNKMRQVIQFSSVVWNNRKDCHVRHLFD
jgi:hypothetical protein